MMERRKWKSTDRYYISYGGKKKCSAHYDLINDNTVKRVSPNSKSIYNSIPCNGLININDMLVLRLIWCAIFECYLTWVAICEIIKNIGKAVYIKFIRLFTQFVLMMPCLIFFPFFLVVSFEPSDGCCQRASEWLTDSETVYV